MKIAILYICIGKYKVFWEDFYLSCEKNFIPEAEKIYYVFTDNPTIEFETDNKNINKIYQENLGWPDNTLKRYRIFLKIAERLNNVDYIFFFNANLLFLENITAEEFLPFNKEKLVGCLHPGYYKQPIRKYPFEKSKKSRAFLNNTQKKYYYQGAINGGIAKYFLEVVQKMADDIDEDFKNKLTAKWHDESHWNHYLNTNPEVVKILSPAYLYPEGFLLSFEPKILIRGKDRFFGGLNKIRGINKKLNLYYIKEIGKGIKNKLIYKIFSLYDNFVNSYFFIKNIRFNKRDTCPRKISVAIPNYNQEKIIHRILRNILDDNLIDEIVILDDGSTNDSFKKTKLKLERLSPKIKLFRREKNLGILTTKIQVIELCRNDWLILLDSDNTVTSSYLEAIYKLKVWEENTIYSPERPLPLLNFKDLSGTLIDFKMAKELLIKKTFVFEKLINDGNYFLNREKFLSLLKKYEYFNPQASDIIFINYIWLINNNKLLILPNSTYIHRIHQGGSWAKKSDISADYFENIRNKILLEEKTDFLIKQDIESDISNNIITKIL